MLQRLSTPSLGLLLLVLVSVLGLALQQASPLHRMESRAQDALAVPQSGLTQLLQRLSGAGGRFAEIRALRQENVELRRQVNELQVRMIEAREAELENEALRNLLGFKAAHRELDLRGAQVVGRVIGGDPVGLMATITLDVGQDDGVRREMPVLTDRGLVGRVLRAGRHSSQVLLLSDPASSVNALIQRSRATGIVEGGRRGTLRMRFIEQAASVEVGDLVLTSGLGGNFPAGLPIGQVVALHQRDFEPFQEAEIRPTVNFHRLELVLVVTGFQPVRPPQGADGGP